MANPAPAPGSESVARNLDEAAKGEGEGLPKTGTEALTSEEGAEGYHPEPAVFGLDATFFVSLAMAIFIIVLLWQKVPGAIARTLDTRIAAIRRQLDEAKALRAEAEALRDEYAAKIADAERQAGQMLDAAGAEADALVAQARVDATDLVARRGKMAEDRIAAAERTALAQVRAQAAQAATAAAARLIADKHDANADKMMIDRSIAGLGRPN